MGSVTIWAAYSCPKYEARKKSSLRWTRMRVQTACRLCRKCSSTAENGFMSAQLRTRPAIWCVNLEPDGVFTPLFTLMDCAAMGLPMTAARPSAIFFEDEWLKAVDEREGLRHRYASERRPAPVDVRKL